MTIRELLISHLLSCQIVSLWQWCINNRVDYHWAHTCARRLKREYPRNIRIVRLRHQRGRPILIEWRPQ